MLPFNPKVGIGAFKSGWKKTSGPVNILIAKPTLEILFWVYAEEIDVTNKHSQSAIDLIIPRNWTSNLLKKY